MYEAIIVAGNGESGGGSGGVGVLIALAILIAWWCRK